MTRESRSRGLTDEERAHIPEDIDVDSEEHMQLFKAFFDEEDTFHSSMTEEQRQGFAAQCTWDAVFAHNALRALEDFGDSEAILVVLVGSGHVVYDQRIQRRAARWSKVSIASVVPVPVRTVEGEPIETVGASYADYLWGLPPETDSLYPTLDISTRRGRDDDRRTVIWVDDESVGARAGLAAGDLLLERDGEAIPNQERLAELMARKRWGDIARIKVQRGERTDELEAAFRHQPPSKDLE